MDRSYLRRSSRDSSPLLPQNTYDLEDLPPRPYSDDNYSDSSRHSSLPPPSARVFRQKTTSLPTMPPPPITASRLFARSQQQQQQTSSFGVSSKGSIASSSILRPIPQEISFSPLAALERRQKALQKDIQALLDAQSAGLMQGASRESSHLADDGSDAGSNTPTTTSLRYGSHDGRGGVVPVRQPKKRRVGLSGARRGILRAIQELETLKNAELEVVEQMALSREKSMAAVTAWEGKLDGFAHELQRLDERREDPELENLRRDKSSLDEEIRELEDRLLAMRARSSNLARRIDEIENKKASEASSFREGKRLLDAEVRDFLRQAALDDLHLDFAVEEREAFVALPSKRRTLGMARDWWSRELHGLEEQQTSIEKERQALEDGAAMWEDVLKQVSAFEEDLRQQLSLGASTLAPDEAMKMQLAKTNEVIQKLEGHLTHASEKGWNLLICAVGAELEAFREGYHLLSEALAANGDSQEPLHHDLDPDHDQDDEHATPQIQREDSSNLGLLRASSLANESFRTAEMHVADHSESEDDGPDPELLVSHEDTD